MANKKKNPFKVQYSSPQVNGEFIAESKNGGVYNGKLTFSPITRKSIHIFLDDVEIATDEPGKKNLGTIKGKKGGPFLRIQGVIDYNTGAIAIILPKLSMWSGVLTASYLLEELKGVKEFNPDPQEIFPNAKISEEAIDDLKSVHGIEIGPIPRPRSRPKPKPKSKPKTKPKPFGDAGVRRVLA